MKGQLAGTAMAALMIVGAPFPAPGRGHPGYAPVPGARLELSYLADAGFADAVTLTCDPDGGGHPHAAAACATLATVAADPGKLVAGDSACYLLYQPITARLTGTWHGESVTWSHQYGNSCEMRRATGVLFDF
jgi:hypothetical protein